jgi:hypothetical protein
MTFDEQAALVILGVLIGMLSSLLTTFAGSILSRRAQESARRTANREQMNKLAGKLVALDFWDDLQKLESATEVQRFISKIAENEDDRITIRIGAYEAFLEKALKELKDPPPPKDAAPH